MITETTARHVVELRTWLDAGLLPNLGPIDTDRYFFATAEVAARVILADLERLTGLQAIGTVPQRRWRTLEDDIEHLHRAISAARPSSQRGT